MTISLDDKINILSKTQTRSERIYQNPEGWIIDYLDFSNIADEQMHTFWPWDEPKVEDDIQDLRVHATPSEGNGIQSVLKLFTHYERKAGDDYWSGRIMKTFKRPEIQRMASLFSAVEMNSHAPFYNKINEVLFVDTPEFYSSWKNDSILVSRMKLIDQIINAEDDLVSIGGFTFIEGAVLYTSFAYLKHFQSQECGKNLIRNINRGINLSTGDENTHAIGGASLFQHIRKERELTIYQKQVLHEIMIEVAKATYEHEAHTAELIFSVGPQKGITVDDLKAFARHRINLCLSNIGYPPLFPNEPDCFIASWFYEGINALQVHDFFTGGGTEYHLNWKEEKFGNVWSQHNVN